MFNIMEDEMVDRVKTVEDAERILSYKNVKMTTSQLFRLYNAGYKTLVLSSDKITKEFIEQLDLSKEWYNYTPLYTNKSLSYSKWSKLVERFEEVQPENYELLLRVYVGSEMPFNAALLKIKRFADKLDIYASADILVDYRLKDIILMVSITDDEIFEDDIPTVRKKAFVYARDILNDL